MDDLRRLRSGPFSTARASGLVTPGELRGPGYVRVLRGAHQPAELVLDHGRRVQGLREVDGDDHVLLSHSAAWALGATFAGPREPVVAGISSHHRLRRRAEVVPHLTRLREDDVVTTPFGLATGPHRTALDLARGVGDGARHGPDSRIARVDALLRVTGVPVAEVRAAASAAHRLRGLPAARRLLDQCADGVDSQRETALRLLVVRAGFPAPVTQCPVLLGGRVVARLDLGWPDLRLGCEYDGAVHDDPVQAAKDRWRHNQIRGAGWAVLQVDRRSIRRPREVLRQLRHLFAEAA